MFYPPKTGRHVGESPRLTVSPNVPRQRRIQHAFDACVVPRTIGALASLMFGTPSQKRVRSRFPHNDPSPPSFVGSVEIGPLFTSDVLDQSLQCCERYEKRWPATWKIKFGPLVSESSSGVGTLGRYL